jgi:hypothetical protein
MVIVFQVHADTDVVAFICALPVVTTALGAGDGIEARIGPDWRVRYFAPVIGCGLATVVIASAQELVAGRRALFLPNSNVALAALQGVFVGLMLGWTHAIAGPHFPTASWWWRYGRALITGACLAWMFAVYAEGKAAVAALLFGPIYVTGHLLGRPLGRQIGEWLEPKDEVPSGEPEDVHRRGAEVAEETQRSSIS